MMIRNAYIMLLEPFIIFPQHPIKEKQKSQLEKESNILFSIFVAFPSLRTTYFATPCNIGTGFSYVHQDIHTKVYARSSYSLFSVSYACLAMHVCVHRMSS